MHDLGGKLRVTDLRKAEAFYCDLIGLAFAGGGEPGNYVLAKAGRAYLALVVDQPDDDQTNSASLPHQTGIVIVTPFHSGLLDGMRRAGATIVKTVEPPWGGIETIFVDPFGNEVSLFSVGG